jgi:hypothetical protein
MESSYFEDMDWVAFNELGRLYTSFGVVHDGT